MDDHTSTPIGLAETGTAPSRGGAAAAPRRRRRRHHAALTYGLRLWAVVAALLRRRDRPAPLQGRCLWAYVGAIYLALHLVVMELSMLATLVPTLTTDFRTTAHISWYQTAYLFTLCIFTPVAAKFYERGPVWSLYLIFMGIFVLGLCECAIAHSSTTFISGRAFSGIGAAGQFSGAMLLLGMAVPERGRAAVKSMAVFMALFGALTGPVIAGGLTALIGWHRCFLVLILMVVVVMCVVYFTAPSEPINHPVRDTLQYRFDSPGFLLLAGAIAMPSLALSWGGGRFPWSSATIIGLFAGGGALLVLFALWAWYRGDAALIPLSCLSRRSIYVGGLVVGLQGGVSQMVPFSLSLWYQAVRGYGPWESAWHLLPSLVAMVVAITVFRFFVRQTRCVPPWALAGSALAIVGAGLCTTLPPAASAGSWVYPILMSIGCGISIQAPFTLVQEFVPAEKRAMSVSLMGLCMQLGIVVSVFSSQAIFANKLPVLLRDYAPNVNVTMVQEAGASNARHLVSADDLPGFIKAYNQAVTAMFYFPVATFALAFLLSFALEWKSMKPIGGEEEQENVSG